MRALHRKAARELWDMKGQALAIAMVVAGGVATFIMSTTTLESLRITRETFYRDYRFADVFSSLKRAPLNVAGEIQRISGVQGLQTRVVAGAMVELPDYDEPVTAQIISIPDDAEPSLNQLYLKQGRFVEQARRDEVVVHQAFAQAHQLAPGDHFDVVINGRRERLRLVGVALSPEYVYQLEPGAVIPDYESFGVFWMARTPLAHAFDMDGAFNDVALRISPRTNPEDVIDRLDALLKPYGGLGAVSRENQVSHRYLSEEFKQLENMATLFPMIFLGVAAFLLNVVISRLIATQREQVAILKAFGYRTFDVVIHYTEIVLVIAAAGVVAGIAAGAWLGDGLSRMYMDYFRFPFLVYQLQFPAVITAALISAAAAVLGTVYSVARGAAMPPAEAMKPTAPEKYQLSVVERLGMGWLLAPPTRMIVRNLERRPLKALLSITGIAFACAILVLGGFFSDAMDYMVDIQFRLAQREDLIVTFTEPTSRRAIHSLSSLPGVTLAEPFRAIPANFRFEHREYRTSLQGVPADAALHLLLDQKLLTVNLPPDGVLLTDHLAEVLGVHPGNALTIEALEGSRPVLEVPVAAVVKEYVGMAGYVRLASLNRMMGEGHAISGARLSVEPDSRQAIYNELREMPRVAGITVRSKALRNFRETMAEMMLTFAFFNTLLAGVIAFGVVYNSMRIAFSERSRELASLRVLGFTRGEITYILLGELALLTLIAVPAGFPVGQALCAYMIRTLPSDLYRMPLVINPSTYSLAATVVVASAGVSSIIIWRKLARLDLIAVLKTKE